MFKGWESEKALTKLLLVDEGDRCDACAVSDFYIEHYVLIKWEKKQIWKSFFLKFLEKWKLKHIYSTSIRLLEF